MNDDPRKEERIDHCHRLLKERGEQSIRTDLASIRPEHVGANLRPYMTEILDELDKERLKNSPDTKRNRMILILVAAGVVIGLVTLWLTR